MDYEKFLMQKKKTHKNIGFEPYSIDPMLFDFQHDLTSWAIRKGKAALWAGTGLGKSFMQIVWADNVVNHTDGYVLILAPLAISRQTKMEGVKIDIKINICNSQDDVKPGINITNYEKLHKFDSISFDCVVLEESSILKNFSGKIRNQVISSFENTKYKLCCSATPSPNDYTEIGNHAEFLNICSRTEMLSNYFVHDSGTTQKWRLKGHAEKSFFEWISEWAVMIEKPSDIGYSNKKMKLPDLKMIEHKVASNLDIGEMFTTHASTLSERRIARKNSIEDRCKIAADINNNTDESVLNWCDLNAESSLLTKMIDSAVEVKGADKNDIKEKNLLRFADGTIKKMVVKPKIAQFGLNLQVCHTMCFIGLSDSFEAFYQSVRRCYRFGQKHPVTVHIVISEKEGNVLENIKRKELNAKLMLAKMVKHISLNTIKKVNKTPKKVHSQKFKTPKFMEVGI